MMDPSDHDLIAAFVEHQSDPAFAEVVRRYLNLVYSAAFRTTGSPASAEDIAQGVFLDLARKARSLSPRVILAGWLYQATTFRAAKLVRTDQRRASREIEAMRLQQLNARSTPEDDDLFPLIDDALQRLSEPDRTAILLRFFKQKDYRSVGQMLGLSEDAARKRVERALERLREILAGRGHHPSVASLSLMLGALGSHSAPSTLEASVTAAVAAAAHAPLPVATAGLAQFASLKALTTVAAASLATALVLVQQNEVNVLRQRVVAREAILPAPAIVSDDLSGGSSPDTEKEELARLQARAAELRRQLAEAALRSRPAAPPDPVEGPVLLKPGNRVAVAELTEAGSATPEAALQSLMAAQQQADPDRTLELMLLPADQAARIAAERQSEEALERLLQSEAKKAQESGEAVELLTVRFDWEDRAEIDFTHHRLDEKPRIETQVFGRTHSGWKLLPITVWRLPAEPGEANSDPLEPTQP